MLGTTMMKVVAIKEEAPRALTFLVYALMMSQMGFHETSEDWIGCFHG